MEYVNNEHRRQMTMKWKIVERGYVDGAGKFQRTSPQVDIMLDSNGEGSGIPVAKDLNPGTARSLVEAHNASL